MKVITNHTNRTLPINLSTRETSTEDGGRSVKYRSIRLLPFGHRDESGERADQATIDDDDDKVPDIVGLLERGDVRIEMLAPAADRGVPSTETQG